MENDVLKFGNITEGLPDISEINFIADHHHWPPNQRPAVPTYEENHTYYKNAALIVLCCGSLILVIICWRWWRGSGRKGPGAPPRRNRSPRNENPAPTNESYMPEPPPYSPPEFDKPPPYTVLESSGYILPQAGASPPEYAEVQKTDEENKGQASGTTPATPGNDHVVNIHDPKT